MTVPHITSDRLTSLFAQLREEGGTAVIPFIPAGWPEIDATVEIVEAAVAGGAAAVEIGWPFSDPMGDGPTNQRAYEEAIRNGATGGTVLAAARELRARGVRVPIIVMGYFNPLLSYGISRFVQDAAEAGVDGLIVVDLPPQEAGELEWPARAAGLHMIYLLAPTSTEDRIRLVAEHGSGFIYCVGVVGITGARTVLSDELPEYIARVRRLTDLPLAVGFGVSSREHVRTVGQHADAAVVGSAFVQLVGDAPREERASRVRAYLEEITGRDPGSASDEGAAP
ncbi:MAG: tryptophan synthase subunit alpha [Chloroflexi bacterium]|nr:tryptophan synthase subunit alpha [Chloroflexota bacterium]MDA1009880.1 tryptophan synthase subunit alpha [Chloroflexota bacterium]MQC25313.1 tryptophan synthase subunit alpha [Chloroflexota bacterium]MQC47485.1 tryptophan synthase subunit alpha [Chloroflexota bacterium]